MFSCSEGAIVVLAHARRRRIVFFMRTRRFSSSIDFVADISAVGVCMLFAELRSLVRA